jgi:hypothetical protein
MTGSGLVPSCRVVETNVTKRTFLACLLPLAMLGALATPAVAIESGDVPSPVDTIDMAGPGQSHTNDSGISGFDGNQGNDRLVGNAGGPPLSDPIEEPVGPIDDGEAAVY